MELGDNNSQHNQEDNADDNIHAEPSAYKVDDDDNLDEAKLKRSYLFGDSKMKDMNAPGMEGTGMGGQKFNENNVTPAGNDKANPSKNAGNSNAYFNRTEPMEEHPEFNNFKPSDQEGKPQQITGETSSSNVNPDPEQHYQEGTAEKDNLHTGNQASERDHIET